MSAAHEDADDGEVSDEDEAAEMDTSELQQQKEGGEKQTDKPAATAVAEGEGKKGVEGEGKEEEKKEGGEGEGKTNGVAPSAAEAKVHIEKVCYNLS